MTPLTHSLEDYIEVIYRLSKEGKKARVSEIARILVVKMPSVNSAIALLKEQGLVTQEPYGAAELTVRGALIARKILSKHVLLTRFLTLIGVKEDIAEKDACEMEHIISAETLVAITDYVDLHAPFASSKERLKSTPLSK